MKVAVLSDIHSNYIALERCLDYSFTQDISTYIFLGDYIGDLAYPERTMQILYDLNTKYECFFIKGNKEEYWFQYRENGEQGWKDKDSTTGTLLYSYKALKEKDMEFFKTLSSVRRVKLNGLPAITLCHGSPVNLNQKLLPDDDKTKEALSHVETSIILCGHSHVQRKFIHNEKSVLNPGAVGMPLLSQGRTQFMILHGDYGKWKEEFISLKYDVDKVILDMQKEKLYEHAPYWSKITEHVLRNGVKSHGQVLSRAMELCRKETGECIWPNISEKYWELAYNEIIGKIK